LWFIELVVGLHKNILVVGLHILFWPPFSTQIMKTTAAPQWTVEGMGQCLFTKSKIIKYKVTYEKE